MVTHQIGALISQLTFIVITVAVTKGDESCGQVNLTATTTPQEITSPGYPDGYENNITCRWNIYAGHGDLIKIDVVDSDLDSGRSGRYRFFCGQRDQVKVYDAGVPPGDLLDTFCDRGTPVIKSKTRSVTIIFQSNKSGNNGKGFQLKYYEDKFGHKISPTINLDANVQVKTFTAPDYKYTSYKFVQMSWRIKSEKEGEMYIRTYSSNLKTLGCGKDSNSMLAYDGYDDSSNLLGDWCESELLEKTASGNYMYIVLNAKPFNDVRFSIEYWVNEESKGITKGSTSLGIGGIAGISIGVIVFIGVTYLAGKILCDKYSDSCDEESHGSSGDNPASRQSLFEVDERQNTTVPDDLRPTPSAPPAGNGVESFPPPPSYEEVIGMTK